jgi:hypothetical protein
VLVIDALPEGDVEAGFYARLALAIRWGGQSLPRFIAAAGLERKEQRREEEQRSRVKCGRER